VDCEKFESLLIDELYGELDEVTSAAVRRHAAGCARCGALLSGLRATRKVAALPVEEPSSDLEDRILSAVREQQKVLPFRARMSSAISRAGAWAMRPQTAMAAVFLVVIGTSFVLVQSKKSAHLASQTSAFSEGAPVQAGAAAPTATAMASAFAFDEKETAFAHGVEEKREAPRAMPSTVAVDGIADLEKDKLSANREETATTRAANEIAKNDISNAGPIGGVTAGQAYAGDDNRPGRAGGGGAAAMTTPPPPMAQSQAPYGSGGVSFGSAKQLYDQQRYAEAEAQWNALAPTDPQAALWAARAEKAKNGCGTAAPMFEQLRSRAPIGNEATLEAARCYRALGNSDAARSRYASLMNTQYAQTAQTELDAMAPVAAARKAAHARVDEHTSRPAATTTTPAQAKPAEKAANSY
jgi:hypothetical protein